MMKRNRWTTTRMLLNRLRYFNYSAGLKYVGEAGVLALREATPVRTGKTADSWSYKIKIDENSGVQLDFYNTNIVNGENVALLIENGHGTKNGSYIPARPFINQALAPIINDYLDDIMEVKHARRKRR